MWERKDFPPECFMLLLHTRVVFLSFVLKSSSLSTISDLAWNRSSILIIILKGWEFRLKLFRYQASFCFYLPARPRSAPSRLSCSSSSTSRGSGCCPCSPPMLPSWGAASLLLSSASESTTRRCSWWLHSARCSATPPCYSFTTVGIVLCQ